MKNLYLFLICSFFIQITNAQKIKTCNIIFSKAYATTIFPGIVMADENGNEVPKKINYSRRMYVATSCNTAPIVTTVLYNKVKAKINVKPIVSKSIELGFDKDGKKIEIKSGKSNFLWEIEIDLGENNIDTNNVKSIILNGTLNKKAFKLNLKEINIVPLIMPV